LYIPLDNAAQTKITLSTMKLNNFYSLRDDFAIIGLTGRLGSGCSEISKYLNNPNFMDTAKGPETTNAEDLEELKHKICFNYLKHENNWKPFEIIKYKDIILLHLLFECLNEGTNHVNDKIIEIICQNGNSRNSKRLSRFNHVEDSNFIEEKLKPYLKNKLVFFESFYNECDFSKNLNENLKNKEKAYKIYFDLEFREFCDQLYKILNDYDIIKRTRLVHDLAICLRQYGQASKSLTAIKVVDLEHIYTIAETINRIIKGWRDEKGSVRFVIDSLKNSLEIMYFKEKFSAFYMVASNKKELDREKAIEASYEKFGESNKRNLNEGVKLLRLIDDAEFKVDDFKQGRFYSPDVENCIQKCDYHIFIDNSGEKIYTPLESQIIKLIALIKKPGLITPSVNEHFMQVAYNAKSNSGCISRQVGAVVTDENYSIKAIGWNDVAEFQVPCGLRDIRSLLSEKVEEKSFFSDFEKSGGNYKDGISFRDKAKEVVSSSNLAELGGRNCAYCFRDFHNAFEGQKNQVHTRSLHAEENAMMQITKYGGVGIKGGKLFTTASPCELCSKKAFQLGIREIFYIDPYPGIATIHTLKNGAKESNNPNLIMFQGAVGRAFHKLYEPFISPKDEIAILTNLKPEAKLEDKIKNLTKDKNLQKKISDKFKGKTVEQQQQLLDKYLSKLADQVDSD
jgi:deoxycytidylate deaminase